MAIDPRISLATSTPDVSQAINIFENALMNSQTRDIRQQNADQQARLNPLQLQQQQQLTEGNQRGLDLDSENRVIKSIAEFAPVLNPALDSAMRSGDPTQVQALLANRKAQLIARKLPTDHTDEAIQLASQGDFQSVKDALNVASNESQFRGLSGQTSRSAGQRERTDLLNDLTGGVDPNTGQLKPEDQLTPKQRSAAIGLGLLSKEGATTVVERLGKDEAATLDVAKSQEIIEEAKSGGKGRGSLASEEQKLNLRVNSSRIKELSDGKGRRTASTKKARKFLRALESGSAHSGATRQTLGFVPGVFTSQAQFDEEFNSFSEVAARQQLKASGELRPTDADVEGMKRAMFGVGRDEATNIQLLQDFINGQQVQDDELEDLRSSKKAGTLRDFTVGQQQATTQPPQQQVAQPQVIQFDAQGNIIQ